MKVERQTCSTAAGSSRPARAPSRKAARRFHALLKAIGSGEKDKHRAHPANQPIPKGDGMPRSNAAIQVADAGETAPAKCTSPTPTDELDLGTRLADQIGRAAPAPSPIRAGQALQVTLHGGMLEGATCQLSMTAGKLRCRLRARGALARREIAGSRSRVGQVLAARGLSLESFEVIR